MPPCTLLAQALVWLAERPDADEKVAALHALASVMGKEMLFRATAVQVSQRMDLVDARN